MIQHYHIKIFYLINSIMMIFTKYYKQILELLKLIIMLVIFIIIKIFIKFILII